MQCFAVGFYRPHGFPKQWVPGLLYVSAPTEEYASRVVREAHPELLEGWILIPVASVPRTVRGVPTECLRPTEPEYAL